MSIKHYCSATRKDGGECERIATQSTWCHQFEGWSSDAVAENGAYYSTGPSWWETCTQHADHASRIVTIMDIRHWSKR